MSKGWHYQLMYHKPEQEGLEGYYAIHEYYPADILAGEAGWTLNPCEVTGDSKEDIIWMLKAMLNDIEKYEVMDYE